MKKIAIVLGLLLIPVSIHTMEPPTTFVIGKEPVNKKQKLDMVTICYVDKKTKTRMEIPKIYLLLSATLQNQLEYSAEECFIPSDQISLKTLCSIQELLPHVYTIFYPYSPDSGKTQIKNILHKKSDEDLVPLANGADYLAIDPLIQQIAQVISQRILADKTSYKKQYEENICSLSKLNPAIKKQIIEQLPVKILHGHTSSVFSIDFAPDNSRIVSGSDDRTIKIWDAHTGDCLHTLCGHDDSVTSVNFSSNSKKIFSSSLDKTIKTWNALTGKWLSTLFDTNKIVSIHVSPSNDTHIVFGSLDKTVKIWNILTGSGYALNGHTDNVNSVAFSLDNSKIVSGSSDKTLKIWDAQTGQCLHTLTNHKESIKSVHFSPDGTKVASGSRDETIKIWDVATGNCLHTLTGHNNFISSVKFSSDGAMIISSSIDSIKIWDILSGRCLRTIYYPGDFAYAVCFSPDNTKIASASWDGKVKIWHTFPQSIYESIQ